jgi:coenzyme Q-binding protein COQ10
VLRRAPVGEGVETLVADMSVGYKAIRESFTSRVTLDRSRRAIDVEYVDGPFRHLHNRWTFGPHREGCQVEFEIDYEFKSRLLSSVMGAVFDRAFRMFTGAFEARADRIYGSAEPTGWRAERA